MKAKVVANEQEIIDLILRPSGIKTGDIIDVYNSRCGTHYCFKAYSQHTNSFLEWCIPFNMVELIDD